MDKQTSKQDPSYRPSIYRGNLLFFFCFAFLNTSRAGFIYSKETEEEEGKGDEAENSPFFFFSLKCQLVLPFSDDSFLNWQRDISFSLLLHLSRQKNRNVRIQSDGIGPNLCPDFLFCVAELCETILLTFICAFFRLNSVSESMVFFYFFALHTRTINSRGFSSSSSTAAAATH